MVIFSQTFVDINLQVMRILIEPGLPLTPVVVVAPVVKNDFHSVRIYTVSEVGAMQGGCQARFQVQACC